MKIRLTRILALSALVFGLSAQKAEAGILLDPYLGYQAGTLSLKGGTAAPGLAVDWDMSGMVYGARVAYTIPLFFFGVDYSMSSQKSKVKSGTATGGDATTSNLFAVAGVRVPFLRAYLGYGLMNSLTAKDTTDTVYSGGSHMKIGGSFTGLPLIAVNLEYETSAYNKGKEDSTEVSFPNAAVDSFKRSQLMLSVSVPFDF